MLSMLYRMAGEFVYPYTITGKVRQFPWRWYWKNARLSRFIVYGWLAGLPLIWNIHKAGGTLLSIRGVDMIAHTASISLHYVRSVLVRSPGNVDEWKQRREARKRKCCLI